MTQTLNVKKEEVEICGCICGFCKSKHDNSWVGCELCDIDICKACGKVTHHSESSEVEFKPNAEIDLDDALHPGNMDWSFDKPSAPHTIVYIFNTD